MKCRGCINEIPADSAGDYCDACVALTLDGLDICAGIDDLTRRRRIGNECMALAAGPEADELTAEDRYAAAKDAISNILTAAVGAFGATTFGGSLVEATNHEGENRHDAALDLLHAAMRSWKGDAEDYTLRPQPGEYGYDESVDANGGAS